MPFFTPKVVMTQKWMNLKKCNVNTNEIIQTR